MIKKIALVWGIIFVIVGLGGFLPGLTTKDDMGMPLLLGLFMVSGWHNVVHLLTGLASIASSKTDQLARTYFIAFGVVYLAVTVIGFILGSGHYVLGFIPVNTADNFLHLAITVVTFAVGFGIKPGSTPRSAAA